MLRILRNEKYSCQKFLNARSMDELFFENTAVTKPDRFVSPMEAAQFLSVSVKFIYERMQRGEIASQRMGRLKRIRLSTLENWLNHQQEWR